MQFTHLIALLVPALLPNGTAQPAAGHQVFVGSTPCDAEPRLFLGITATVPCERITWHLALADKEARRTFSLRVAYGMQARNDPGFQDGGIDKTVTGTWATVNAPGTNRDAADYRLTSDTPRRSLELRKVGHGLLHLLTRRGGLMVGNGGWSYTLNRTDGPSSRNARASFEPVSAAWPTAAGVFEGRTPCRELDGRLGAFRIDSGCMKLKWKLTLHHDAATGAPTRYVLEGSAYRRAPRIGTWAVLRNRNDPGTIVYRLDPDDADRSLSFIRADDNILLFAGEDGSPLVGDKYFSYTLNRVRGKGKPADFDNDRGMWALKVGATHLLMKDVAKAQSYGRIAAAEYRYTLARG